MSELAATGLEGGLQIVSNLMNNLFAGRRAKKQYQYDKKLLEQQNQYNIDMWNMQNEYNSPKAQMERFSDAGLNPNLIYSQGNNGNATAPPEQQVARYQAPQFEVKGIENVASTFLQERNFNITMDETKRLNDARINLLKQQAISESMSQTSRLIDDFEKMLGNAKTSGDLKLFRDTYEDRKRAIGLQNENLEMQRDLNKSMIERNEVENDLSKYRLETLLPLEKDKLQSEISHLEQQSSYQRMQNELFEQKIPFELNIINNMANESNVKVDVIKKQLEKARQEVINLQQRYKLTAAEAIVLYVNTLKTHQGFELGSSQIELKKYLKKEFGIEL